MRKVSKPGRMVILKRKGAKRTQKLKREGRGNQRTCGSKVQVERPLWLLRLPTRLSHEWPEGLFYPPLSPVP